MHSTGPSSMSAPDRIGDSWSTARDSERQKWVRLVELFYQQIRYGCTSPACQKSACRSCRTRLSGRRPYRVPTAAAAKHWATVLASEPDARSKLCHHPLKPMDSSDGAFAVRQDQTAFDTGSLLQQLFNTDSWHKQMRPSKSCTDDSKRVLEVYAQKFDLIKQNDYPYIEVEQVIKRGLVFSNRRLHLDAFNAIFEYTSLQLDQVSPENNSSAGERGRKEILNLLLASAGALRAFLEPGGFSSAFMKAVSDGPIFSLEVCKSNKFLLESIGAIENTAAHALTLKFLRVIHDFDLYEDFFDSMRWGCSDKSVECRSPWRMHREISVWVKLAFRNTWRSESIEIDLDSDANMALMFLDKFRTVFDSESNFPEGMGFVARSFDIIRDTVSWMKPSGATGKVHLLTYTWLFGLRERLILFRSANYCLMLGAFEKAMEVSQMVFRTHSTVREAALAQQRHQHIFERMKPALTAFLVLQIRRENILEDALHQLWRREQRELRRPLKIKMGMDMGEEGVDLGGVQQEFFRLAIAKALEPDLGFFDVDSETRMAWFRPFSPAPLLQFALLGMLFGLAVYNSVTLPVTFPTYFYRILLRGAQGKSVSHKLDTLQDGWPIVYKGLKTLLEYEAEDVEDTFALDFSFTVDLTGKQIALDMRKDLPLDSSEAMSAAEALDVSAIEPVTNSNRREYVELYTDWLLNLSVKRQCDAFLRGFQSAVIGRTLNLFQNEREFKDAVEGTQVISVIELKQITRYLDGYTESTQIIRDFWEVVEQYSQDELRQLLEFVTASERVPAAGIWDLSFIIQRNGSDDDRLPTSMTCFGRLLMPHYSSKKVLKERMRVALENCEGFGVA